MPFTQANRRLKIKTPLGADDLLLLAIHGQEGVSSLFAFEVELISEKPDVSFDAIVGKNVTASIQTAEGDRYVNGIVSRFAQSASRVDFTAYTAHIVPWLWFLTRTSDCRIFQNLTVPDILKKIFGEYGFSDYKFKVQGAMEPRDYCVQYRETDYNFVARLLEEEGICYFFEHEDGKHTLVMTNNPKGHEACPGVSTVRFVHTADTGTDDDIVLGFDKVQEVRPGKYALTDYNFETPSTSLMTNVTGLDTYKMEIYDYPGEYTKHGAGDALVKIRQQEEDSPRTVFNGSGVVRAFTSGYRFDMTKHPASTFNETYMLTSITHDASERGGYTGEGEPELSYENTFQCVVASLPYRPPRLTPEPKVMGVQTAVVVGPAGEEIYVDKYGRVKVQFFWDREGKRNENSSCWIRVAQNWAGKNWGLIANPRIGQEVIVDFLEGDPDRPIITGRVYNAEQVVPYALPANKTQTGIKSRSSMGGTPANFNEIRFEDKKGAEQVYIHAEKNEDIIVENDKTENVGHDETITIGNDRTETVGGNETLTVEKNRQRTVVMNEMVTVALTRTHSVGINEAITVGAMREVTVGVDQAISVGNSQAVSIGNDLGVDVGSDMSENIGSNRSEQVGKNKTSKVGETELINIGKDFSLTAGESITLNTGDATIQMKKDGTILIRGKDISIDASGRIDVKASKNITMKGQKILQN